MAKKNKTQAASAPRKNADPYYPTDYSIGKRERPKVKSVKPYSPVLPFKKWLGIVFFSLIPLINFIPLIAWSNKKNSRVGENQRNFAKSMALISLLFWVVVIITAVLLIFVFKIIPLDSLFASPNPEGEEEAVEMILRLGSAL